MITYAVGDATSPKGDGPKIIAHICNDYGGWGAGFVKALSARWNQPELAYRQWYDLHRKNPDTSTFKLGNLQLAAVGEDLWVANMIAQHSVLSDPGLGMDIPLRLNALEECLGKLTQQAKEKKASVHMPRIGCGLAGGNWAMVKPLIEKTLVAGGVKVTVYDL